MEIQQVKTNLIRLPLEEPLVGAPVFVLILSLRKQLVR